MLATCQPGYERQLAAEFGAQGITVLETGVGWITTAEPTPLPGRDWVFPHWMMRRPREIRAGAVNAQARALLQCFTESLQREPVASAWPCRFATAAGAAGLARRAVAVEQEFHQLLRRRLSRVGRLADAEPPRGAGIFRGLFVFFGGFDRVWVAREAELGGQRRMADDPQAPSRSYLKIEEAYGVLGAEPQPGQSVIDLGAAPGGWSYSAAKRGARVVAVDNGPLRGGARAPPLISPRRADAVAFRPARDERFDWLFCDLIEEPNHVLRHLLVPWLAHRWCRRFVVNLKLGRADPVTLLAELRRRCPPCLPPPAFCRVRHLYHDRDEITVVGRTSP